MNRIRPMHHHQDMTLNRMTTMATAHCLVGCGIGEVLGMLIGTAAGWTDWQTIALAVVLAFAFGLGMTLYSLVGSGLDISSAVPVAIAADGFSITVMEIVDNAVLLALPGALNAHVTDAWFWGALAIALAVAYLAAWPVNRWLIARGRGHALHHAHHDAASDHHHDHPHGHNH